MFFSHFDVGREVSRVHNLFFFSSIVEWVLKLPKNFYDVRITVAQATQLRRLNVGTSRQRQCIHLLAFAPKQKININRSFLFPVGQEVEFVRALLSFINSCVTVSVINRQFDALFQTEILFVSFKRCSAPWSKESIDPLSFDYCSILLN